MIYFTLEQILIDRNLSRYWLSKQTGIDNNTLGKICNNESKQIKLETLEKICDALNITPNDILKSSKPIDLFNYLEYNQEEKQEISESIKSIPTDKELLEIEQIQERLDLEYTLEDNLESIINTIISNSNLNSLPIRIKKEIEAYSEQKATSFQFKFILAYRSLFSLIVSQSNNKRLIEFMSRMIKIYNNGGLYELNETELDTLLNESEELLIKLNTKQKD